MRTPCCWLPLFLIINGTLASETPPLHKLSRSDLAHRLDADVRAVQQFRRGIAAVPEFMNSQPGIFPREALLQSRLLSGDEKEIVWATWQQLLDYLTALQAIERYHANFYRLKNPDREISFLIGYAAASTRYGATLEFLKRAERNSELHKVLDEPVTELGIPAGAYSRLKLKYLSVSEPAGLTARAVLFRSLKYTRLHSLYSLLEQDAADSWHRFSDAATKLTARNALQVVRDGANEAWLPIQTGVAEWMGDTKVYRRNKSLITAGQIEQMREHLEPGDILLERRDWYLSNIGLPGFWPHAALYIGTAEERAAFFRDPEVQKWVIAKGEASGEFEALLRAVHPTLPTACLRVLESEHPARVIESVSEGVCLTSLEHSAACDSIAAIRPRLGKVSKAAAILRAWKFLGRPYDFNFDFGTDSEIVCTELVYKAYEGSTGVPGLAMPVKEMLGRKVLPANEIVRLFSEEFGTTECQFDLVLFYDGQEGNRKAVEATVEEFCRSWKRPKWHVLTR